MLAWIRSANTLIVPLLFFVLLLAFCFQDRDLQNLRGELVEKERTMSMMSEFKALAIKGNAIDMTVGIVIGAKLGKIVSSFGSDVITASN